MAGQLGKKWVSLEATSFSCDHTQIKELRGREAISQLFEFDVQFAVTDTAAVNESEMLGDSVSLVFSFDEKVQRKVHGMICQVDRVFDRSQDFDVYQIKIVPQMWGLTTIKSQELYLKMSVPEIIAQKLRVANLGQAGTDYEMRLDGHYPEREYVVQYQESDYAFICRLAEHYGISFYFEHDEVDKIVFTDGRVHFQPIEGDAAISFPQTGDEKYLYDLRVSSRLVPKHFWMRDYNYNRPALELVGKAALELPVGTMGAVVDYGANFSTPEEGAVLATARSEEAQARQTIYQGKSDIMRLNSGGTCTVDPSDAAETGLLIVEIEHRANQSVLMHGGSGDELEYRNEFRAIPADRCYRPPRRTPVPRIHGVMTGFVKSVDLSGGDTMPDPPVAHIDDKGRYYVELHFDTPGRDGQSQGRDILPIRMSQPSAGADYGMHLPLRPGTEVNVAFIGGDPDRPMIIGAVNNGTAPNPVQAKDANKSRIKTQSGVIIQFGDA